MVAVAGDDIEAWVVQHSVEIDTWNHTFQAIPEKSYLIIFCIMGYKNI